MASAYPNNGLTPREIEVLELIYEGYSNRDLIERLHISPNTVRRHLANIFDKTGLSSRRELMAQHIARLKEAV